MTGFVSGRHQLKHSVLPSNAAEQERWVETEGREMKEILAIATPHMAGPHPPVTQEGPVGSSFVRGLRLSSRHRRVRHEGQLVNSKRVRRLMREHGPCRRSSEGATSLRRTATTTSRSSPTWRPTRGRERGRCRLNLAQLRNNLLGAPGPAPPGAKQNCQLDQRTALADHVCTRRSERAALRRKSRFGVLVTS